MSQLTARVDLAVSRRAPGAARRFAEAVLGNWGLPDEVVDAALLVVSELVTNVVLHAGGQTDAVQVQLDAHAGGVRLGVVDGSAVVPLARALAAAADDSAESGRGVGIVQALAERWGVDEHHGGKRVWVELGGGDRLTGGA